MSRVFLRWPRHVLRGGRQHVRWIVAVLMVGACSVLGVLLVRTFLFTSRQLEVDASLQRDWDRDWHADWDAEAAVARFAESLTYQTLSAPGRFQPQAFTDLHQHLERAFPSVHRELERDVVADCSLLYRWAGSNPKARPILLMSHLDVVPVLANEAPRWTHDAWSGTVADGYIWGRGALDVKCGALSMLEAIEFLLAQGFEPTRDIYLAFGHDEEVGGANGNAQIALRLRQRRVYFDFVLDEGSVIAEGIIPGLDAALAMVGVAEKGYANIRLAVDQTPGHSSMPPSQTAVGILCKAISRLEENPCPATLNGPAGSLLDWIGPELGFGQRFAIANRDVFAPWLLRALSRSETLNAMTRTTTAATLIHGGETPNILPAHAEATVNFRILPGDTPERLLQHVRDVIDDPRVHCRLLPDPSQASNVSDQDSESFRTLCRTIRGIDSNIVVAPGLSVVATDSRHYEGLAENIYRFLPMPLTKDDVQRIHGIDERISKDNYLEMVRFMIRLMQNSATLP